MTSIIAAILSKTPAGNIRQAIVTQRSPPIRLGDTQTAHCATYTTGITLTRNEDLQFWVQDVGRTRHLFIAGCKFPTDPNLNFCAGLKETLTIDGENASIHIDTVSVTGRLGGPHAPQIYFGSPVIANVGRATVLLEVTTVYPVHLLDIPGKLFHPGSTSTIAADSFTGKINPWSNNAYSVANASILFAGRHVPSSDPEVYFSVGPLGMDRILRRSGKEGIKNYLLLDGQTGGCLSLPIHDGALSDPYEIHLILETNRVGIKNMIFIVFAPGVVLLGQIPTSSLSSVPQNLPLIIQGGPEDRKSIGGYFEILIENGTERVFISPHDGSGLKHLVSSDLEDSSVLCMGKSEIDETGDWLVLPPLRHFQEETLHGMGSFFKITNNAIDKNSEDLAILIKKD